MSASTGSLEKKYTQALDDLVAQIKEDRSILAAILCGSLAYDTVWARSDIDLALITLDDRKLRSSSVALYAAGVNVHAFLMQRAEFRKTVEGSLHNSFTHSLLASGRLLYTHDATLADMFARLGEVGARDTQIQLLASATRALQPIDKAHKWLVTRGDLDYTALWILYAATPLARIEVIGARRIANREVIPQAMRLNPALFQTIYTGLLNQKKTRKNVQAALDAIDGYLARRAPSLFQPVLDHLRDAAEARSATEIEDHFKRNFDIEGVSIACEYLAAQKLIGTASMAVQLTPRSNVMVQELGFVYLGGAQGEK